MRSTLSLCLSLNHTSRLEHSLIYFPSGEIATILGALLWNKPIDVLWKAFSEKNLIQQKILWVGLELNKFVWDLKQL